MPDAAERWLVGCLNVVHDTVGGGLVGCLDAVPVTAGGGLLECLKIVTADI